MLHWIKSRGGFRNFSRGFEADPSEPPEANDFEDLNVN